MPSDAPSGPGDPTNPENPAHPDVTDDSRGPEVPETVDRPDTIEEPGTTEQPDITEEPGTVRRPADAGPAGDPNAPVRPRLSGRELVGPTMIFVGTFLVSAAIALPALFVGKLQVLPLDTDDTVVARSTAPAQVLDQCSLDTRAARVVTTPVTRQQRVVAVRPAGRSQVTLQAGTSLRADDKLDDCSDGTISAIRDRVTLDRETATFRRSGSSEIQYDDKQAPSQVPDREGVTYAFPFDVPRRDARFFDPVTRTTVPLRYDGDAQVEGEEALRFVAEIPDTDLYDRHGGADTAGRPTVIVRPASWFGLPGNSPTTLHLHHRSTWEISVDPATGTILDERITIDERYRLAGQPHEAFSLINLATTLTYTKSTRDDAAARAGSLERPVTVWGRWVPIGAGVVGVLLIGAGIHWLLRRSPPVGTSTDDRPRAADLGAGTTAR